MFRWCTCWAYWCWGAPAPAFALAALWGVHPLLTESVTNIVGRADLLAAFGVLAGLLCYVKSATAAGRRKLFWVAAMVAAQAVGIFSKENAAVLPGIMLLYDLTWRRRTAWRGRALAYAALVLPLAAFFYLRGTLPMHILARFGDNPLMSAGFWTARLTAVKVIGKYLWLFVWPARLSADYSYNAVPLFGWHPAEWEDAKALIALAVCLGAALLAVRWYRTRKPLFFFLAFFFVALAPTSNLAILIGSIMAERFVYLPSIGLAGCVVAAIYALGRQVSRQRLLACELHGLRSGSCAWHAPCEPTPGTSTGSTISVSGPAPWTFVRKAPRRTTTWGTPWRNCPAGCRTPLPSIEAALRIEPDYAEAHYNLGNALSRTARPAAGRHCRVSKRRCGSIPITPRRTTTWETRWRNCPAGCRTPLPSMKRRCGLIPIYAEAHNNLGIALAQFPAGLAGGHCPV